jgi:hypothetical protein
MITKIEKDELMQVKHLSTVLKYMYCIHVESSSVHISGGTINRIIDLIHFFHFQTIIDSDF